MSKKKTESHIAAEQEHDVVVKSHSVLWSHVGDVIPRSAVITSLFHEIGICAQNRNIKGMVERLERAETLMISLRKHIIAAEAISKVHEI